MSLSKSVVTGIFGAYLTMGLEINKIDFENQILYITIPSDSYEYHNNKVVHDPESLAKRIKETWIEMGIFPECRLKYKVKDISWTEEMGEKNFNDNIGKIINLLNSRR